MVSVGKYAGMLNPLMEDLRSLVDATNLFEIQRVMLGRGSNLIIPDDGFAGLVIRLKGSFWSEISFRSDEGMVVGAGLVSRRYVAWPVSINLWDFAGRYSGYAWWCLADECRCHGLGNL